MTSPPDVGPLLVGVPGLGLDSAAWRSTFAALPGRPWVVSALPAYGERPGRGEPVDPATLAGRLVAGLPDVPVVLLGHSASCQVVAGAAAAAPGRVAGLVLVGPTTDPRARSWPALGQRWLRTAAHERPGQVPVLVRSYARTGLGHMVRAMDVARRDRIEASLAGVGLPVLVLRGRHDRICPPAWAERVAAAGGPGSRAETLTAGAHMVPLTHGGLVAAAVGSFLASVGR